ncbi:AraC family transcriptional regulator [Sneathiella sp.]|jgi:AraC-like DNA-binding protein|uniref:AraC family transcriptional regulator n=1 Tax=Sneathiella sp. TaxID=1964365 RepID=UPI0039E34F13
MHHKRTLASYTKNDFVKRPVALRVYDLVETGIDFEAHHHKWGQLAYTAKGVALVQTEQGRWLVPPGHAVWIPAEKTHSININAAAKFFVLHIDADKTENMPPDCCVLEVSPLLASLISHAEGFPAKYEPETPESRIMAVILDQMQSAKTAPLLLPLPTDDRLVKLVSILMNDPADTRDLQDLSRSIGTSARNLTRLFKKETGMTFGKWRQQRRIMAAIELLAEDRTVTEVALDMGYESVSAFISVFKQIIGVTPSRYFKNVTNE